MKDKTASPNENKQSELLTAVNACKSAFITVCIFSMFINVLLLVPTIYMLQVYDRVLASNSQATLLWLTIIVIFLFLTMGGLEWARAQIMNVTGNKLDRLLNTRVYNTLFSQSLISGKQSTDTQALNDLNSIKQFMTGAGLFAFFDVPWFPLYMFVLYLFHPVFGIVGLISAVILVSLAIWNERSTKKDFENASKESNAAQRMTQTNLRNAEVIEAMGMLPNLRKRWQKRHGKHLNLYSQATAKSGLITSTSKTFRLTIQSLILGLGAYLAIENEISGGLVIAGSILLGRALAPMDQAIAHWRPFLQAREAYHRLDVLLNKAPDLTDPMPLPPIQGKVQLDKCIVTPPGASAPVLKGVSFSLDIGEQLAIIGPSAAGKSTLARTILGLYLPQSGSVRFDGAEPSHWDRSELGQYIGYLPQDVELLDGSISENIARFNEIDSEQVVKAAQNAGIHEMVLQFENGYDTVIEGQGHSLSAGQRQRLGLARALYKEPKIILLDEPNSNLDTDGDAGLHKTLDYLKEIGSTVIIITHRNNILQQVDKILVLAQGEVVQIGSRDEVLTAMGQAPKKNLPSQEKPSAPSNPVSWTTSSKPT